MDLSCREIEVIRSIRTRRQRRIKDLLGMAGIAAVYLALRWAGILGPIEIPLEWALFYLFIGIAINAFSKNRTDDQYAELLQRYVNNDSEALEGLQN